MKAAVCPLATGERVACIASWVLPVLLAPKTSTTSPVLNPPPSNPSMAFEPDGKTDLRLASSSAYLRLIAPDSSALCAFLLMQLSITPGRTHQTVIVHASVQLCLSLSLGPRLVHNLVRYVFIPMRSLQNRFQVNSSA